MPCTNPQPGAFARVQNKPTFPVIQLRLAKTVLPWNVFWNNLHQDKYSYFTKSYSWNSQTSFYFLRTIVPSRVYSTCGIKQLSWQFLLVQYCCNNLSAKRLSPASSLHLFTHYCTCLLQTVPHQIESSTAQSLGRFSLTLAALSPNCHKEEQLTASLNWPSLNSYIYYEKSILRGCLSPLEVMYAISNM